MTDNRRKQERREDDPLEMRWFDWIILTVIGLCIMWAACSCILFFVPKEKPAPPLTYSKTLQDSDGYEYEILFDRRGKRIGGKRFVAVCR